MKSPHDEALIKFCQQHQPQPPPAPPDAEDVLMAMLETTDASVNAVPKKRSKAKVLWFIPPAIAASVVLVMGRAQMNRFTPGLADSQGTSPLITSQVENETEESLEVYLETVWSEPLADLEAGEGFDGYTELMYAP